MSNSEEEYRSRSGTHFLLGDRVHEGLNALEECVHPPSTIAPHGSTMDCGGVHRLPDPYSRHIDNDCLTHPFHLHRSSCEPEISPG